MTLKRLVDYVEMLAVVLVIVFVLLLFRGGSTVAVAGDDPVLQQGAEIYAQRCAGCHGPQGQGYASRPALHEGLVVAAYPDPADQIALIANGRGSMPGFGGSLSAEELEAVVRFTREAL